MPNQVLIWAQATQTFVAVLLWPLQDNRGPGSVALLTLLGILMASITARRGWRWNPNAAITGALTKLLLLLGEKAGMRADKEFSVSNSQFPICNDLTPRERRWFIQPLWRQSVSVFMIVALMLATTETNVHASLPNPIFYYFLNDHLGSSNVITDRNGVLVQHYEYWAFGSERSRSEAAQDYVSHRYTGQIYDDETGLYYYGSRYYDPELGRFTQPDTIVPDPSDSQQFNRYSYVNNNPLKYTDPTGHDFGLSALIAGVVIGAAIGAATAAASGGDIGTGLLTGALGGVFGFVGSWAGGAIGGAGGAFAGAVGGGAAGGAVSAAITGGHVGFGALSGAIAGAIGFGVSQLQMEFWDGGGPSHWIHDLFGFASSAGGGALGGGIGSVIQGGSFGEGAAWGAVGGVIGYGIAVDLPDVIANAQSGNPRPHLFLDILVDLAGAAYDLYKGDFVGAGLNLAGAVIPGVPGVALKGAWKGGKAMLAAKGTEIVAQNGTKITGFTKHGIDRVVGDGAKRAGVKPEALLDALKNPKKIVSGVDSQGRPFQTFVGENARVVVNPRTGQVVSVNPLSGAGAH